MLQIWRGFLLLVLLSLTGCGFHLRGEAPLPPLMQSILVEGGGSARVLLREFEYQLLRQGGQLSRHRSEATIVLRLSGYQQKSRVVALDSNGYAREKELSVSLSYTVLSPQLDVLLSTRQISLHADVLVDKDSVIASDRAAQETYQALQQRLAISLLNTLRFDLQGLNNEAGQ